MPSVNTAPTGRMHFEHQHALKSPAAHKPEGPQTSPHAASTAATKIHETPDNTRAKGVLRLLEEDHFHGVAAVRLRMNFHAELQQKDAAAQTGTARSAAMQLQTGMAEILDEARDQLGEALVEPVEAVFRQFDQAVANGLGNETAASDIRATVADAVATLRSELVSLLDADDVFVAPDTSTSGETGDAPAGANGGVGETDDTTVASASNPSFLQRLLDDIDQLAAALDDKADSTTRLSGIEDIVAPSGNGVAFEKFVEQYQARFGTSVDQNDEPPLIDDHA